MAGKDHGEKQKEKIRIKVDGGAKEKTAQERLAELELELKTGSPTAQPSASTSTPATVDAKDLKLKRETAETIFSTHAHSKKLMLFWGVLIVSIVLSKLPGAEIFFTPLNQFATMVHEMSHAFATILTGGWVQGMTIVADGQGHGGLTMSAGGIPFIHVQAGYLGTAIFGSILVYLSQFHKLSKGILIGIGALIGIASLIFILPALLSAHAIQAFFSLFWAGAMAGVTIFAGLKLKDSNANLVLLFLAIYTAMDSLRSIGIVIDASLFGSMVTSDATSMERLYILPALFWSLMWVTLSAVMLGTTVWFTYGPGNKTKFFSPSSSKLVKKK